MLPPLMIAVAPNGARKTKQDHPALPTSAQELAATARECREAGACMIHLHVRDKKNGHTLDPILYEEAIRAIRKEVKDGLILQITTEAVGIYNAGEQIEVVKAVRPEAASIALREFCPDASYEKRLANFLSGCIRKELRHSTYSMTLKTWRDLKSTAKKA